MMEQIQETQQEKMCLWNGYTYKEGNFNKVYSITLSKERFKELWKRFKKWNGSQEEFYFKYVNPFKIIALLKKKYKKN